MAQEVAQEVAQKSAPSLQMISGEGALNCYSVLLYSAGALSHSLLLSLVLFVSLNGGLSEAVVVPPAGQRRADGKACAHQLLHLGGYIILQIAIQKNLMQCFACKMNTGKHF